MKHYQTFIMISFIILLVGFPIHYLVLGTLFLELTTKFNMVVAYIVSFFILHVIMFFVGIYEEFEEHVADKQ